MSLVHNARRDAEPNTLVRMDRPVRRFDVARLWEQYGLRLVRYGGVTVVSTVVGLTTLAIGIFVFDWPGVFANFVSVCASTPPAYLLNRKWVWGREGDHSTSREVAPFWIMTFFGFVVSTIAIGVADTITDSKPILLLTQIGSFAALWLLKFAFLEKVLWPNEDSAVPERV